MVGGPMRPVGISPFGRAVAAVTSSPFGVGPGRFHYSETLEDVDTVYLGAFHRQTVIDAGGYDEVNLQWAAEDQELNFRIRRRGGRILLDPVDPLAVLPAPDADGASPAVPQLRDVQGLDVREAQDAAALEAARARRHGRPVGELDHVSVGSPAAVVGDAADRRLRRWAPPRSPSV